LVDESDRLATVLPATKLLAFLPWVDRTDQGRLYRQARIATLLGVFRLPVSRLNDNIPAIWEAASEDNHGNSSQQVGKVSR
jgi:hypothetical protein